MGMIHTACSEGRVARAPALESFRSKLPSIFCAMLLGAAGVATSAAAGDWPQWRGPQRDGLSAEKGLLKQWPAEGPKLLWHAKEIGSGYSTPAVVGDRIYLVSNEGMEKEFVQARSAKDGSHVWATPIGKVGPNQGPQYPGARSTVSVDGDVLYALGSDGDLACLETATGKVRWKKNLRSDFGGQTGNWAYAESPLIDGDVLVVAPGGATATVVALDKKTGEPIWKTPLPTADAAGYSSAVISHAGGVKQYVQFLAKGVVGLEAKTGKLLWRYEKTAQGSPANIPTPIIDRDLVYSGAGRSGAGLVKIKSNGDSFEAEQIYFTPKLPTAIGGAVKIGDYIYGTTGQALVCAEFATGMEKWSDRSLAPGSLCYADGMLYLHGENGSMALIEATPEGYREKGRFSPPGMPDHGGRQPRAWSYPVIAGGKLYLHDFGHLWCYDLKP